MLDIARFLTPLAHQPNPNAAVGNALQGRQMEYSKTAEQNRLAEQQRHSMELEKQQDEELGFRKQVHGDTMGEHEEQLHTKLIEWGTQVLNKEGTEKARAIVGPVWGAAGIDVDFGGGPDVKAMTAPAQPAPPADDDGFDELQRLQKEREAKEAPGASDASAYAPKPGESMSQYVARGKSQVKAEPTEKAAEAEATEGPEAAAVEETEAAVTGQPQPWRIYNRRTGKTYGLIDPGKVEGINAKRAYDRAVAYSKGTPEEGRPIVQEFVRGARDEADVETRMGHAEKRLAETEKTRRAELVAKSKGGPGQIGGPIDEKLLNQVNGQLRMYVSKAVDNSGVKALNTKAQDSARISGMIESASSGAQRQAFATQLHANFGAASSEGERAFQLEQAGVIQSLLAKVDAWASSGQLPEGLKQEIAAVARMQQEFARKYADEIRKKATADAMNSPALGGLYDRALGHQLTPEEREKIAGPISNLGGIEGSGPAESGSADQEFDKLGI